MNNVDYFDTTNNSSIDIMYDIFEEACYYDMGHILLHCIFVKSYFTLDNLNFRMMTLNYGSSVSTNLINKKKSCVRRSLKMIASEMRTFVRTISLLFGDLVYEKDPVWHFYLILRDIIDILSSVCFQEEMLVPLKHKITEHY